MVSLTLLLSIDQFRDNRTDGAKGLTQINPSDVTRMAFVKKGYDMMQISNQNGPQNDGMLEVIDAIKIGGEKVDVEDATCVLIVRVESTTDLDTYAAQNVGKALDAYMTRNTVSEFATAAIGDITNGQDLHDRWNTLVFVLNFDGVWQFKNLGCTSIQRTTDGNYAVLRDNKLAKIGADALVSTLLDDATLDKLIDGGHQLQGEGKKHLVRAPIKHGGAYAVVGDDDQTVYDDTYNVIASGKIGFIVMPAINADGAPIDCQVTTISGRGDDWDIRLNIPAKKADGLAQAYGAPAA